MKVGSIDAEALGPFNRPTVTDQKKKKNLLYFGCNFFLDGTISGKSLKLLPLTVIF